MEELPEEIILLILRMVHDTPTPNFDLRHLGRAGHDWARYNQGTRDIQNVRLTSRMLSRIGSEVLIQFVGIDVSLESLARFQAIMGHPAIRRGVRMVRIRLAVYDRVLSNDWRTYYREKSLDLLRLSYLLDAELKSLAHPVWHGEQDACCSRGMPCKVAMLAQSLQDYRELLQAQEAILQQHQKFIQDVANALEMSDNKALRVEFTEQNDFPTQYRLPKEQATTENFLDLGLRHPLSPRPWRMLRDTNKDERRSPAHMIPDMLAAFADKHINIVDLGVEIPRVTESDREKFGELGLEMAPIRAAMRNLRNFTYYHGASYSQAPPSEQETRPELSTLLHQCLPPSLQTLELRAVRVETLWGRCLGLTEITLDAIYFDNAKNLEHLLQSLEPHYPVITLSDCWISGGSWADVLDILRSKQRKTCLIRPGGGEFKEIRRGVLAFPPLSPDNRYDDYVRRSQQYIRGYFETNPLRRHRN